MAASDHDPMRPLDPDGPRCRARNRRGEQCRRQAIPGGTVCRYHGGSAPQVLEAARRRLASFVLDSLDVMEEGLRGEDRLGAPIPYAARLKAATEVLDRAGVVVQRAPTESSLDVTVTMAPDLDRLLASALDETRQLANVHRARVLDVPAEDVEEVDQEGPQEQGEHPTQGHTVGGASPLPPDQAEPGPEA